MLNGELIEEITVTLYACHVVTICVLNDCRLVCTLLYGMAIAYKRCYYVLMS